MNVLIIDDDPLVCDLLEHFCSKLNMNINATITNSGFEAINLINQSSFDLILLDYDLPDITGKEILFVIDTKTPVIMVTSNKDFGYESYNFNQVIDYLVKPIEFARFYKSILKVKSTETKHNYTKDDSFFIKDGTNLTKIQSNTILFIKSAGNYLEFVMENRKVMTLMTLKDIAPKLDSNFFKTHRSYIINLHKVDKVTTDGIKIGNHTVPLSKTFETTFLQKLNLLN